MLLPDTHVHLDASVFAPDLTEVLARAREAGVDRILTVGSDLASSRQAIALAHRYDFVYAAVGIHPHEVSRFVEEAEAVHALLSQDKVVAVGEIGLDYYRDLAPREVQVSAFRTQIGWAQDHDLPISVHNRAADDDILAILGEQPVRAILHCFSGSPQLARRAVQQGLYLSFAGNVTFPRAGELREAAAVVPADRILVETDAPVLSPQPWRGRRNEPAHVVATAEQLATVRGKPLATLAAQVTTNAGYLFRWGAP